MGLTGTRPGLIKAVGTESFKRLYVQDLEDAIKRADTILEQITTQIRRSELERQVSPQSRVIRQQLEVEHARQEAAKAELQMRLREAEALQLNMEFTQGTGEGFVEVSIGDNLFNKLGRAEILVKDGIIMEIREEG